MCGCWHTGFMQVPYLKSYLFLHFLTGNKSYGILKFLNHTVVLFMPNQICSHYSSSQPHIFLFLTLPKVRMTSSSRSMTSKCCSSFSFTGSYYALPFFFFSLSHYAKLKFLGKVNAPPHWSVYALLFKIQLGILGLNLKQYALTQIIVYFVHKLQGILVLIYVASF